MGFVKSYVYSIMKLWDQFWFTPQDLINVSLFRFFIGLHVFQMYVVRFFDFKLFFTNKGMMPVNNLPELPDILHRSIFPIYFKSDNINLVLYVLFLLLLLALSFGLLNRILSFFVFLLHLSFMQRNPSIIYGADLITTFWLFYLSFVDKNKYFRPLDVLRGKSRLMNLAKNYQSDMVSSVFIRFMQIQLCVLYAYTGMEKLKGMSWWDGTAVWYVMGNRAMVPFDLSFFQHIPWAVGLMTFATLVFEIYFPLAVTQKKLRYPWLILGFCFHLGTALFMGLYFFAFNMIYAYILFLNSEDLRKALSKLDLKRAPS